MRSLPLPSQHVLCIESMKIVAVWCVVTCDTALNLEVDVGIARVNWHGQVSVRVER